MTNDVIYIRNNIYDFNFFLTKKERINENTVVSQFNRIQLDKNSVGDNFLKKM